MKCDLTENLYYTVEKFGNILKPQELKEIRRNIMGANSAVMQNRDEIWKAEDSQVTDIPGNPVIYRTIHSDIVEGQSYMVTTTATNAQEQKLIYNKRKIQLTNLVTVYESIHQPNRINCMVQNNFKVITERIHYRLSDFKKSSLTSPEIYYILLEALKGYKIIHSFGQFCLINDRMIGIKPDGTIKVWLNQNWAVNQPARKIKSQHIMIEQIINTVQQYCLNTDGLGKAFKLDVYQKSPLSFTKMQSIMKKINYNIDCAKSSFLIKLNSKSKSKSKSKNQDNCKGKEQKGTSEHFYRPKLQNKIHFEIKKDNVKENLSFNKEKQNKCQKVNSKSFVTNLTTNRSIQIPCSSQAKCTNFQQKQQINHHNLIKSNIWIPNNNKIIYQQEGPSKYKPIVNFNQKLVQKQPIHQNFIKNKQEFINLNRFPLTSRDNLMPYHPQLNKNSHIYQPFAKKENVYVVYNGKPQITLNQSFNNNNQRRINQHKIINNEVSIKIDINKQKNIEKSMRQIKELRQKREFRQIKPDKIKQLIQKQNRKKESGQCTEDSERSSRSEQDHKSALDIFKYYLFNSDDKGQAKFEVFQQEDEENGISTENNEMDHQNERRQFILDIIEETSDDESLNAMQYQLENSN